MKKSISLLVAFALMLSMCIVPVHAAPQSQIKVLINGTPVNFTADTGYPYIDENNRTMVPLRVTMEAAGCAVGFDNAAKTAIIISPYPFAYSLSRVEVPIGTDYIYDRTNVIQNDTYSVIRNGRTYLPIRVVFEALAYHVEWDAATKTVDIHNFNYKGLTSFNTGNRAELLRALAAGDVVRIEGEYYATADYLKRNRRTLTYDYDKEDLNIAQLPYVDDNKSSAPTFDEIIDQGLTEWISEDDLRRNNAAIKPESFIGYFDNGYSEIIVKSKRKQNSQTSANTQYNYDMLTSFDDNYEYLSRNAYDGIRIKGGISQSRPYYFKTSDLKAAGIIHYE